MSKLSKEIKECVSCPQINGKPYGGWGTLNSKQRINIWNLAEQCEMFEEIADKSMKELTKYKRAFEILKGSFDLKKRENMNRDVVYLADMGSFEIVITKEEYELLEELMKGENS